MQAGEPSLQCELSPLILMNTALLVSVQSELIEPTITELCRVMLCVPLLTTTEMLCVPAVAKAWLSDWVMPEPPSSKLHWNVCGPHDIG